MSSPFLNEARWIRKNSKAAILYDAFPVSKGHMLVIPRRSDVVRLKDLSSYEALKLFSLVAEAVEMAYNHWSADAVNVGINDGEEAGQTVKHLHVHVIPRYRGDVEDPRGGVRGVIPSKQMYNALPEHKDDRTDE